MSKKWRFKNDKEDDGVFLERLEIEIVIGILFVGITKIIIERRTL